MDQESRTVDRRPAPSPAAVADVAVVIVAYNSARHLPDLLTDLRAQTGAVRLHTIVVDNESTDSTATDLADVDDVLLVPAPGNLGYAGAINLGMRHIGDAEAVLVLNPDLRVDPDLVSTLHARLQQDGVGVVVPKVLTDDGRLYPSLRFDPTLRRTLGDAVLGSKVRRRPAWSTETDWREDSYTRAHPIDWATGACLLVRREVAAGVGPWDERYFLYSEEVDFLRRARGIGWSVWFEPDAVVRHEGGGSGTSPELAALMAVNKVRYGLQHRGPGHARALQAVGVLAATARLHDAGNRRALHYLLSRDRWEDLPAARRRDDVDDTETPAVGGCVLVPAHEEESVIARTLGPLAHLAASGEIELIVAANGCTDRTVERARAVPGARVLDLPAPGKAAALNCADREATRWPRLYLDADVDVSARTVRAVFATLQQGQFLAARPAARYDTEGATWPVRAFYRARLRTPETTAHLWGAGVYALSEAGHRRLSSFPELTADDLYVDSLFSPQEKVIVATDPVTVHVPRDLSSLLKILVRTYQGNRQLSEAELSGPSSPAPAAHTLAQIVRHATGPRRASDALTYAGIVLVARVLARRSRVPWTRDESTRLGDRSGRD